MNRLTFSGKYSIICLIKAAFTNMLGVFWIYNQEEAMKVRHSLQTKQKWFNHCIARSLAIILILTLIGAQTATNKVAAASQSIPSIAHISHTPKGHPPVISGNGKLQATANTTSGNGYCTEGVCYYWATMTADSMTATGASVSLGQPEPVVGPNDYHSLAELAVESADGQQIVEIGWIVASDVNGDSLTHLFVYHWVNGEGTCYNGCGFVPTSTTYTAGGLVEVKTLGTYGIQYTNKDWVLTYNGTELGYFPESLWGGSFTKTGLVQAFGEVASSSATKPHTQMGNSRLGTSSRAALISGLSLIDANTTPTWSYTAAQAPSVYKIGHYNTACTSSCSMNYGGPGY